MFRPQQSTGEKRSCRIFSSVCSKITRGRIFLLFSFCFLLFVLSLHHCNGEMQEWLNWLSLESVYTPKGYRGFESPSLRPNQEVACLRADMQLFYAPANAQAGCAYSRMPEAGEMQIK